MCGSAEPISFFSSPQFIPSVDPTDCRTHLAAAADDDGDRCRETDHSILRRSKVHFVLLRWLFKTFSQPRLARGAVVVVWWRKEIIQYH